jgi:hypothetical protein
MCDSFGFIVLIFDLFLFIYLFIILTMILTSCFCACVCVCVCVVFVFLNVEIAYLVQFHVDGNGAASAPPLDRTATGEEVIMMKPDMAAMKKYKSLRDLAPESPMVTLAQDTFALCIDMFKLCMASMLCVFVPQSCPASEKYDPADPSASIGNTCDGCTCEVTSHDCTFEENFRCLITLNKFTLAWNFICLGLLIFHYFLVWRREHFIISNFKETLTLGRLHVRDIISDYPTIQIRLRKFNRWVFNTSVLAILFQTVNIISSGVLLFGYYNDGYKTFTTFFTNLLLISMVLYNCVSAAYIGLKHELAYSCVAFEPVSYNAVGPNCVKGQ